MKKHKMIILSFIILIIILNLFTLRVSANTEESYTARTYIDYPLEGIVEEVKDTLTISGWYMSTDANAELKVYIDDTEMSLNDLKRENRQDVLKSVTGYGTELENPLPGYSANIDISNITNGYHTITTNIISSNGNIIASDSRTINVQNNYTAKMYIDSHQENTTNKISDTDINIKGWVMTDDINSQIKIYIDNTEQNVEIERSARPDVISAITGYGTAEQNPTPGYSAKLDLSNISNGNHTIKICVISRVGEEIASNTIKINLIKYPAKMYIDNPASENAIIKDTLTISGWYMSTDANAQLKIYINNEEQDLTNLTRVEREDVLKSITGYGTEVENPQPGYSIDIDVSTKKNGKYTILAEVIASNGEIIATETRTINIQNYTAKSCIDSHSENITNNILGTQMNFIGWIMTDDVDSQIKIYIDGTEQNVEISRIQRADVISAITGYGTAEQNPTPGYSAKLDLSNISDGEHIVKIAVISRLGDEIASNTIKIELEKYRAKIYTDNPASDKIPTIKDTLTISGWYMSTDANANLKIYIDGEEQELINFVRSDREDVLNSISGYGTKLENPQPGYSVDIDVSMIKNGIHTIVSQIIASNGEVIATETRKINVQNYKASIYIDNPTYSKIYKNYIDFNGWIMTNDTESQIKVYIDGIEQNVEIKRTERNDVISSITGYGTAEQNPTPGYEMTLDLSELENGNHDISISVISRAGETLASVTKNINIQDFSARMDIDSPTNSATVNSTLEIEGWYVSTDENSTIKIFIDDEEQEIGEITKIERDDVLETITGYDTKYQNQTPGFIVTSNLENIKDGTHKLRVEVISQDGVTMTSETRTINVNKYYARECMDMPVELGQSKSTLNVIGWIMSTDEQATIKFYINDIEQTPVSLVRTERDDVISAVTDYGTAEQNPTPGYEAEIDISSFEDGKYALKIEVISREGEVMFIEAKTIVIYNKYDFGIDVSNHNGTINWEEVAQSGVEFAIIRAGFRGYGSTGSLNQDTKFVDNMNGAISNGIDVGVYFYSQAITVEEAIEEAEMTIRLIEENGFANNITLPVVIDTERSSGRGDTISAEQRTAIVKAFCERIKQAGYQPMIYSNKDWLEKNLNMNELSEYDVWVAQYTGTDDPVNNPTTYAGSYQIWQYTSSGSVPGISGSVDIDIAYKKYLK